MPPVCFNLRSWNSNCSKLHESALEQSLKDKDAVTKVLGLSWNPSDEMLMFQQNQKSSKTTSTKFTKGELLRESSKMYDPFGILTLASNHSR